MIKKGFTLLEMLVVIGIIAVLVGMVATSYSTAQKKARDAKRQGDLKTVQQALEQCYSVNGYAYPLVSGNGNKTISDTCPAPNGNLSFSVTDPLGTNFTVASTTTSYTITATLETGGTFAVSNQQ